MNFDAIAQRHNCKRASSGHQLSAPDKRETETATRISRQVHLVASLCAVGQRLVDVERRLSYGGLVLCSRDQRNAASFSQAPRRPEARVTWWSRVGDANLGGRC